MLWKTDIIARQLLEALEALWKWDPGEVHGKRPWLCVLSSAIILGIGLLIGLVYVLTKKSYFSSVYSSVNILKDGVSMIQFLVIAIIPTILLATITLISTFSGFIIYHSSSPRSYIGYVWQGAVVAIGAFFIVFLIVKLIVSIYLTLNI